MKEKIEGNSGRREKSRGLKPSWTRAWLFILMICCGSSAFAQQRTIRGLVVNAQNEPVIGASVTATERETIGTSADVDGTFTLSVPADIKSLTISYVGMIDQVVPIPADNYVRVTLQDDNLQLNEVMIVGFGTQPKASVVGAITQTTGEVLERAAGITDISAALTGQLPGVITLQGTGQPGMEEAKITVRAASSWNSSDPLVLVDGIERPMASVDIASVQTISVLKDASATAVYGVKGANGVILITTRRGQAGRARINVGFTTTMKQVSKLPGKFDAYDAMMLRNVAIEHELGLMGQESWSAILPQSFIENFRNQTTLAQRERYPNVDWQDALFKSTAMSYQANLNVSGGTQFVQYFVSADYVNEGDLYKKYDNNRGYSTEYSFNRIIVRANLDFQISPTTKFSMNLGGTNGTRRSPWERNVNDEWQLQQNWAGVYGIAPDVFLPRYSDGAWGYYPNASNVSNSAERMHTGGAEQSINTRIETKFSLEQQLDFITKGLRASGSISWDNSFSESRRGINDLDHGTQRKWINPETGIPVLANSYTRDDRFDWAETIAWGVNGGTVNNGSTTRNLFYQFQLNWAREFGKHNFTAMGVVNRNENARGSTIPSYREDWAFRATYGYDNRYNFEYNGAYNGSEKFAPKYRFAFFNSGAVGWMISEEKFMQSLRFLDMFKVRYSYGEIGDDNVSGRWLYMSTPSYGGNLTFQQNRGGSPYTYWQESALANPDVRWETVRKSNFGIDYSFLNGLFAGSVEIFKDKRRDILISGNQRSIPSYLGIAPSTINFGKVETKGYELELRINKVLKNGLRLWANMNMNHSENKIIERDDPQMRPSYQKQAGYSMGQTHSHITAGFINNYDQLYGSTMHDTSDQHKLPGDYITIDFNNDGVIDSNDSVPWGYTGTPQNTFSATIGADWKGFSAFVQLYGTSNVTRSVPLADFALRMNTAFDSGTWWSMETPNADVTTSRWAAQPNYKSGIQYLHDGSYLRIKNAEVGYSFTQGWVKRLGMGNLRVYLNGNNLWVWTKMPDDRESNLSGSGGGGSYPTVRRFNLGIRFTL